MTDGPVTVYEYALRLDCARQGCSPPHRDAGRVFPVGTEPPEWAEVNGHAAEPVVRAVEYHPWTSLETGDPA